MRMTEELLQVHAAVGLRWNELRQITRQDKL